MNKSLIGFLWCIGIALTAFGLFCGQQMDRLACARMSQAEYAERGGHSEVSATVLSRTDGFGLRPRRIRRDSDGNVRPSERRPSEGRSDSDETALAYLAAVVADLKLVGLAQGRTPAAVIELRSDGTSREYRVGEQIKECAIVAIRHTDVKFSYQGCEEFLKFGQGAGSALVQKLNDSERIILRRELPQTVRSLAGELNRLRISPAAAEGSGGVPGLQLNNLSQDGVLSEVGLQNDDVVCSVNGVQVKSVPQALMLVNTLKKSNMIELSVLRNNSPVSLRYYFQ